MLGCHFDKSHNQEKKFFDEILKKKYKFIKKKSNFSNYNLLKKYNFIISVDSTLSFEAISRNLNVGIFDYRPKITKAKERGLYISKEGKFWTKSLAKKSFIRIMNHLYKNRKKKQTTFLKNNDIFRKFYYL